MIRVTTYVDIGTLLLLTERNEDDIAVSLVKTEHEKIEVQIPIEVIKYFDEANELAIVSKWKYERYSNQEE
jgi:chorismate mutase